MMMIEEDEAEAHQVDMESGLGWTNDFSCEVNADLSLNLSIFKVDSDHVPSASCRRRRMMLDAGGFHGLTGAALRKTKASSRRNAWGNQSYAELITRAIESTPEKRLTLSQIYDWMVRYVPYFKDKGDSNSSAGWKVTRDARMQLQFTSSYTRCLTWCFALIKIVFNTYT